MTYSVKAGDRVGVGCMVESCRHCKSCGKDWEQCCENGATYTYNANDPVDGTRTFGGYSEKVVVAEHFVLKVPDAMDLAGAAPLLCAGITTYSPLRHWNVLSTDAAQMAAVAARFDLIIDTVPYQHDVNPYPQHRSTGGGRVTVSALIAMNRHGYGHRRGA